MNIQIFVQNVKDHKLRWVIGVILTFLGFIIVIFGSDIRISIVNSFSSPSVLMNITETTNFQIDQAILGENFFFVTRNALGWIVSMNNINDPRTGGRIGTDTDLIPNLVLCNNCSLYYIYIENNGESNAKNIEIEIMNNSVQEDTIGLTSSFGGTEEDLILKCNQKESLCILEIDKLKPGENVALKFIGEKNGINTQCQVDNDSTFCSSVDYINVGIIPVSPDFQVELGIAGSSEVIEIPPLPKFELSDKQKCYELDQQSFRWIPASACIRGPSF